MGKNNMDTFNTTTLKVEGNIIGIIGCRKRNSNIDLALTKDAFADVYRPGDIICSGGCPKGGDRFAEILAKELGITILIHYPNWEKYGKSAGYKRNIHIAKYSTILIACVAQDRKGGTEDTINKFKKHHPNGKIILV